MSASFLFIHGDVNANLTWLALFTLLSTTILLMINHQVEHGDFLSNRFMIVIKCFVY